MTRQMKSIKIDKVESALEDIRNGKVIIVVDDEARENEGCEHEKPEANRDRSAD